MGNGHGGQVAFEAGDVGVELMSLERPELLVSVSDALHHGRAPANGQFQLHDLLQVSVVLCRFGLLSIVSFDLGRRHLLLILKIVPGYANAHAAAASRPGAAWQCRA